MSYKRLKKPKVCLECGDEIIYGRSDKKFCCTSCKNKYNYFNSLRAERYRQKILAALNRNYQILDRIMTAGADSIDLEDAICMGFDPYIVTSHRKTRSREEYSCFDIKYIMTPTRIKGLSKYQYLSLNLQAEQNDSSNYEK